MHDDPRSVPSLNLAPWFIPLLVLIVGITQVSFARLGNLTPWKGGGFGMFASLDGPTNRFITATAMTSSGESLRIRIAPTETPGAPITRTTLAKVRNFPTQRGLDDLARALLATPLVISTSAGSLPTALVHSRYGGSLAANGAQGLILEILQGAQSDQRVPVVRVDTNVVGLDIDPATNRLSMRRVGPTGQARRRTP